MGKWKTRSSPAKSQTDFTTPTANLGATTSRLLCDAIYRQGTLAITLYHPMRRYHSCAINVLRSFGGMGKHMALGTHDSNWWHNLDTRIYRARHSCRSHGWVLHPRAVPKPLLGGLCNQMQPRTRENIWIILRIFTRLITGADDNPSDSAECK
jgi:hypothetical protein